MRRLLALVAFALTLLGSDVSARGHNMGKLEAFQKSDGLSDHVFRVFHEYRVMRHF